MHAEHQVYEPSDDTYLVIDALKEELGDVTGDVSLLDIGAGSGEIGFTLASDTVHVTCTDINKKAIEHMDKRRVATKKDITIIHSDLFENIDIDAKFDVIAFNTPYLPNEEDSSVHDIALHGGPKGNEVALEFLREAKHYVVADGVIILLVSSLGQPDEIESFLDRNYSTYTVVARKKLFFEELLVYRITI